MNTKPDDVTLALWLDDELEGEDLARVDAWASGEPEQLAAREETRRWRAQMAAALPRRMEPPYADFFNTRIQTAIAEGRTVIPAPPPVRRSWWFMPVAAAAGMALAFWLGNRTAEPGTTQVVAAPVVYTPDSRVQASYFPGKDGSSTVIVLEGVSAIPDSLDFRDTAWTSPGGDFDSTASASDGTPAPPVR